MFEKMTKSIAYITALSAFLFVSACSSPPKLPNVSDSAEAKPVNTPEQIEIINHRYAK